MTFTIDFKDCSVWPMKQLTEPDLTIQKEDLDKAKEIGLITSNKLTESDYKDFPELCQEIDFLLLQEQHDDDDMFDDLEEVINQDCQEVCGWQNRPLVEHGKAVIVRVVMDKGHFFLGSIAGQPVNVYIPYEIAGWRVETHSYYHMDLTFTPYERNQWTASRVYSKLNTCEMLISESKHVRYGEDVQQHYVFDLPTPSCYIGAMIGKDGRNINNLISRISSWICDDTGYEPEFTFTPCKGRTKVDVYIPHGCPWEYKNVLDAVSHFHC